MQWYRNRRRTLGKSSSSAWLTIPRRTLSISLTEVEMCCFTSRRFIKREKMLYVKRNKAISLENVASKVGIEVQQLSSKDCTYLSSKEIAPQYSINHLAISQARKPETQWTPEERKDAILDQRLKSLILSVLLNDQINSVINYLTAKSTWDVLLLFHEGPSDVKNSREFQDNLDDEEDTRSSHEYLDDLWRDYQAELFSQA
ncbi:hypothetical protein Tco_1506242 [Tanacetum coccineum]